jgi:general nucleoside transport system permease protein
VKRLRDFFGTLFGLFLGLSLGLLAVKFTGESPVFVAQILFLSAFGSMYDLGITLFYAAPIALTGLSVAFSFRVGLFNIGAEGQLTMGALALSVFGINFSRLPPVIAIPMGVVVAFFGGACWGALAGWLRAYRGSHEVITTIMLNFIATSIASYVTLYWFRNTNTQNPEMWPIGNGFILTPFEFFGKAPITYAVFLPIAAAFLIHFLLNRTVIGFRWRAVGKNDGAAQSAGINAAQMRWTALAMSGGLAGLVGVIELMGNSGKFKLGFSPDYGFIGIAVALLARGNPVGVLASAFLFGALHKGATDLDLETENVTRDLSLIIQAAIVLSVTIQAGLIKKLRKYV